MVLKNNPYEFLELSEYICGFKFMEKINEMENISDIEAGVLILAMAKMRQIKRKKQLEYVENQIRDNPDADWYKLRKLIKQWLIDSEIFIKRFIGKQS